MKPCADCWVEAQRRELTHGVDPETAYVEVLLWCPTFHDATQTPPVRQGSDPWARS